MGLGNMFYDLSQIENLLSATSSGFIATRVPFRNIRWLAEDSAREPFVCGSFEFDPSLEDLSSFLNIGVIICPTLKKEISNCQSLHFRKGE